MYLNALISGLHEGVLLLDTAREDYWTRTLKELNYIIRCRLDCDHPTHIIWHIDGVEVCVIIYHNFAVQIMGEGFTVDTTLFDPHLFNKLREVMIDLIARFVRKPPCSRVIFPPQYCMKRCI